MIVNRTLWSLAAAFLFILIGAPSEAMAQTRRVSNVDTLRVERLIRDLETRRVNGVRSLERAASGTITLVERLRLRGATQMSIDTVVNHYSRTSRAIRIRIQAEVNRRVNLEFVRLDAVSGADDLRAQLIAKRDEVIQQLVQVQDEATADILDAAS